MQEKQIIKLFDSIGEEFKKQDEFDDRIKEVLKEIIKVVNQNADNTNFRLKTIERKLK